jgi:hypothetical protein
VGAFAYGIAGILRTIKIAKSNLEMGKSFLQYGAVMLGLTANACRDHVPSAAPITYIEIASVGVWALCALEEFGQNIYEAVKNRDYETRGDGYKPVGGEEHSL